MAPYLAYVAAAALLTRFLSVEMSYVVRIVAVPGLLLWAWRWYVPLTGPRSPAVSAAVGVAAGLAGCALWVLLMRPFVDPAGSEPWSPQGFFLRLFSATLIVPVFEELFVRGYLFRLALQWDRARRSGIRSPLLEALDRRRVDDVAPGEWTAWAVVLSTVAFALGHTVPEWPASIAYGLLMIGLWVERKDLLSCIVAHGTTNLALGLYVRATGGWGFW
jgi:membrane protease YdiL (CAAX protease family)